MTDVAAVAERMYRADSQQPTVCCVMLVNGRPEMTRRAIASFRGQTYENKRLLILDTGKSPVFEVWPILPTSILYFYDGHRPKTIGYLRNRANQFATDEAEEFGQPSHPDLIAHFDSDDWSHPRRLEEQIALLEASGKQCVGYNELLFWDTRWDRGSPDSDDWSQAWLYTNHQANWAPGGSLLYRRELWERQPFDDAPNEDTLWLRTPLLSRECLSVSALKDPIGDPLQPATKCDPRMVCGIHGGNTSTGYERAKMARPEWRRVLGFDAYCERTMKL